MLTTGIRRELDVIDTRQQTNTQPLTVQTLKKRADFLTVAKGRRIRTSGFLLQAFQRSVGPDGVVRVGITCSKKLGGAVVRNRAKRRLRHLAQETLPHHGQPGWDYVLIGFRDKTVTRPFASMTNDLKWALKKIHSR